MLHLGCCSSHRSASVDCERQANLKLHTASLIPTSCISNCGKEMETGYFGSFFWYFGYIKWMDYMEEGRDLRTILEVYFFFSARLSKINNFGYWSPKPQASRRAYLSCPVIEMMLNWETLFSSIVSIRFFLADLVFVILKVTLQSIF